MRLAAIALAVTALTTMNANALDLGRLSERLLDCDGPGIALADKFAGEFGTADTESQGMAILELVELVIEDENATLRGTARSALGLVKQAALNKANALVDECDIEGAATIANPFATD